MVNKKILYPITEESLQNYSIDNPPLLPLYRNYSIQEEYDKYIYTDKYYIFIDNMKQILKTNLSSLQLNDFPYYTTNNIKHYVLWINKDILNIKLNYFIKTEIDKYFTINKDINNRVKNNNSNYKTIKFPINENVITYYINIPKNMSIKEILHVHIFTKSFDI